VTYMQGVGHWPMLEAPAAFEAELLAAVNACGGSRGGDDG
jgi:hypothetical protein